MGVRRGTEVGWGVTGQKGMGKLGAGCKVGVRMGLEIRHVVRRGGGDQCGVRVRRGWGGQVWGGVWEGIARLDEGSG